MLTVLYEIVNFSDSWKQHPIIISGQDIAAAFDTFKHSDIFKALIKKQLDPLATLGFMREYVGVKLHAQVRHVASAHLPCTKA